MAPKGKSLVIEGCARIFAGYAQTYLLDLKERKSRESKFRMSWIGIIRNCHLCDKVLKKLS
jgi:hypothetical protein